MELLLVEPVLKVGLGAVGILNRMKPGVFGQIHKQFVRRFPQMMDYLKSFPHTLMKVTERVRPAGCIRPQSLASGLRDEHATLNISSGFAIRDVMNDFMDTPTVF